MTPEHRQTIARLFREQHGVASRAQLLGLGIHPRTITRLRAERWESVHDGVYRIPEAPLSDDQDLMAACLAVGADAAVSHVGAAWLHGFETFPRPRLEVVTTTDRKARGIRVHKVTHLIGDVTRVRGIPVTQAARTLVDVLGLLSEKRLRFVLDDAIRRNLVDLQALHGRLSKLGRGHRGIVLLRRMVADRLPSDARAESELETRLLAALRRERLPAPVLQHEIWLEDRRVATADFAYPEAKVAIFTDGWAYHSDRSAFEFDRRQQNELAAAGWLVLRYTWRRLEGDANGIATEIVESLERQGTH